MGSSPTLAQAATSGHDPADPATRAAEDAFARLNPSLAFAWPNPYLPGLGPADLPRTGPAGPQTRRDLVRMFEAIDARGYRAWLDEVNESPPTPPPLRQAAVRHRAEHAQLLAAERAAAPRAQAEETFTQLNPDFAVLPDHRDPQQHRFAADREQALALGTRAVEALRAHNHPDPQRRERAVAGITVEAKLRAAGYDHPTRQQAQRAGEPAGPCPLPQRPAPERARGGPER